MQSACAILYCRLWPLWPQHIFPHYLINGKILGRTLLNAKCVFCFSLQILSETFLFLRWIQRNIITNTQPPSCKYQLFLSDMNQTWTYSTDVRKKTSTIKFHRNLSGSSRFDPCGLTDGGTDTTKFVVAFRNFPKASHNSWTADLDCTLFQ